MVKNEEMVSPEPFFFWGEIRRQRLQPPLEQPPRAPDLYMDGLAHWVNAPCYWSYLYSCTWREIRLNTDVFSFVFMTLTPTKTTRSQRDELFAKSDFHESIRLNADVLYLRNNESCIASRSGNLARRVKSTKRSLHIANAFLKRIGSCVVENKRNPKRTIEKRNIWIYC